MNWHDRHHGQQPHLHVPLSLPQILAAAHFPIYGIIGNPGGISPQSVGYTHGQGSRDQHEPIFLQVSLRFSYPPAALRPGFRLELTTTNPGHLATFGMPFDGSQLPAEGNIYDVDGRPYTRYTSIEEVTQLGKPIQSCVIERFPLSGDFVIGLLRHFARPNPEWHFSLTHPGLRLTGLAWEYTQDELLDLLPHIGLLSDQAEIQAQYQHDMTVWANHFRRS